MIDRFMLYSSNLLPTATEGAQTAVQILAGHPHGFSFASQISKVETLRSESTFGTLLRGLQVYGSKVLDGIALAELVGEPQPEWELAAGLLQRERGAAGHETLRLTDVGLAVVAETLAKNRARRNPHEALVERVAREMTRAGRLAWRGLSLRARVGEGWAMAMPDVFSIRHTTVEAYAAPIVHEIKVQRADLLADLRRSTKREAYLQVGGECWYVIAEGIAEPAEVPAAQLEVVDDDVERRDARRRLLEQALHAIGLGLRQREPRKAREDAARAGDGVARRSSDDAQGCLAHVDASAQAGHGGGAPGPGSAVPG